MTAAIEDAVEVDRVELPAGRDGRDILIEAGDQGDVARAGFGRDASVRDAESAFVENFGAQIRGEGPRDEVVIVLGVRLGKGLESLVGSKTVACGQTVLACVLFLYEPRVFREVDKPTKSTSLSAGALLAGGILGTENSRMPDTTGLTKYMSKMDAKETRWKMIAMAKKPKRVTFAMMACASDLERSKTCVYVKNRRIGSQWPGSDVEIVGRKGGRCESSKSARQIEKETINLSPVKEKERSAQPKQQVQAIGPSDNTL